MKVVDYEIVFPTAKMDLGASTQHSVLSIRYCIFTLASPLISFDKYVSRSFLRLLICKVLFKIFSSIGLTAFGGIGTEFQIRKHFFFIELLFFNDISKNKLLTLKNIEDDGYFFCRLQSFQLRLGHAFSLKATDK